MGLTLEFDDLALFGYLDELGSEFDAELWVGVASMGDDPEVGVRTVGLGSAGLSDGRAGMTAHRCIACAVVSVVIRKRLATDR